MKSGGNSTAPRLTNQGTPGTTAAPGTTTAQGQPGGQPPLFNPQFTSFLNQDPNQINTLQNVPRQEFGAQTPLLAAQQAAPMAPARPQGSGSGGGMLPEQRRALADLVARQERDKMLARVNKQSAGGGSQASGSFSGSAFGGGGDSGGLY